VHGYVLGETWKKTMSELVVSILSTSRYSTLNNASDWHIPPQCHRSITTTPQKNPTQDHLFLYLGSSNPYHLLCWIHRLSRHHRPFSYPVLPTSHPTSPRPSPLVPMQSTNVLAQASWQSYSFGYSAAYFCARETDETDPEHTCFANNSCP